jgi:DNA replication protein DnaC
MSGMGYNRENYSKIKRSYEAKRGQALSVSRERMAEIHQKIPAIAAIDSELANTGILIMEEIRAGKEGLTERLENIRLDNEHLQAERRQILKSWGYPPDYTDVHYECPKCQDTGIDGLKMCSCMRFALTMAGFESSGLGRLFEFQNFDTFSLRFYNSDPKVYEHMSKILTICYQYAETFDKKTRENVLLMGKTGLGKTHLSTAMAGVIIERGFEVVYESAQNLFDDYSAERFGRTVSGRTADTARYGQCDLLIIDDLGTESSNSFTVGCLYNLINSRIMEGKPMLINTNLGTDELKSRYGDRIFSRLFGEFNVYQFLGTDIRMQKRIGK